MDNLLKLVGIHIPTEILKKPRNSDTRAALSLQSVFPYWKDNKKSHDLTQECCMSMFICTQDTTQIASQLQNRTQYPIAIHWDMQLQKYFIQCESFWVFFSYFRIIELLLTLAHNIPFSFAMRVLQEHLRCRVSEYAQKKYGLWI